MKICLEEILLCKEIGANQKEVSNFKSLKIGSIILYYSYDTTIPRQVGLSGSSSIIIATLRSLMKYYSVPVRTAVLY